MRPRSAGWWVGLILLGALAAWARGDEPLAPGTLSGRLVDPDGRPVAGARVSTANLDLRLQRRNGRAVAESDAEGRFRLGPLEPLFRSDYVLTFEAPGLVALTTPRGAYTVYPGEDHDLGSIPLERGRVFTGTVLDADGTPRAGVAVSVSVSMAARGHFEGTFPGASVVTDEDGRFRTGPLPVGRLALVIRVPGRQPTIFRTPIRPVGVEDVGALKLVPGVAVSGVVRDEAGRPVAGVQMNARGETATTDERGGFTIDGLAPNPTFPLTARKRGFGEARGVVTATEAGVVATFERGAKPGPPAPELVVPLRRVGTIEGSVVDADTGAPVKLARVLLNSFWRQPDGAIVQAHTISTVPQRRPGRYEATFDEPREYQLVLSAEGYHDAEVFTPVIAALEPVEGAVVRLRRDEAGTVPPIPRQSIGGAVARAGEPVRNGWVAAWFLREPGAGGTPGVARGRVVPGPPVVAATAPIRDGVYDLDIPFPNDRLFLVVDAPGRALTLTGPVALGAGEARRLDIAGSLGGAIRGRVEGVPAEWRGQGFLVAFDRGGLLVEARVAADGTFALPPVPAGEYGLKAGHDAYDDPEVATGRAGQAPRPADPWRTAARVTVEAGRDAGGVVVAWPE